MRKKSVKVLKIVLLVGIVVVVLGLLWLSFIYTKKCETKECFDASLEKCKRAEFVKEGDITFWYKILGEKEGNCKVYMKVLNAGIAEIDEARLVGKSMFCWVPSGLVVEPESQISECHGILKEELQDMIIENLHRQLVQNIGEINDDLGF